MDAMKILGGLLNNKSLTSSMGSQILTGVLGGGGRQRSQRGGLGGVVMSSLLTMAMQRFTQGQGGGGAMGLLSGGAAEDDSAESIDPQQANAHAELLVRAMVYAAKADGRVDDEEQQKLVSHLGDVSDEEKQFVRQAFAEPMDTSAFARSVPTGMEEQVYTVSLMAIDLDTNPEARYLAELSQAMGISEADCNRIHEQLQAPKIFA